MWLYQHLLTNTKPGNAPLDSQTTRRVSLRNKHPLGTNIRQDFIQRNEPKQTSTRFKDYPSQGSLALNTFPGFFIWRILMSTHIISAYMVLQHFRMPRIKPFNFQMQEAAIPFLFTTSFSLPMTSIVQAWTQWDHIWWQDREAVQVRVIDDISCLKTGIVT